MSLFAQARVINIPLCSLAGRIAAVLLVGIPAASMSICAVRIALAARLGSHLDAAELQRAIVLDPGNATYDYRLGLVYGYSLDQGDLRRAIKYLKKATEMNPRKALYWSDLADVCDTADDAVCSDAATKAALRLSPTTPQFEWKAANHYLRTGRIKESLQQFRHLLELDPAYAQPVFQISLRIMGSPAAVLREVIPPGAPPRTRLALLDFATEQGNLDVANEVWNQIVSNRISCEVSDVKSYVDGLLAAGEISQAAVVWQQLEQVGVVPKNAGDKRNLVYNGDFIHEPLNAGFDWRTPTSPYVETDFNDPSGPHGLHCLRVDYAAGKNLESEPVYEFVPVTPGQKYTLQAYVRSENITSDSGPRLRIVDPQCPGCLDISSATTVGTTSWHALTVDFTTAQHTRVARLSIWRARSRTFPMEISGSFWLSDVSITAVGSQAREATSAQ